MASRATRTTVSWYYSHPVYFILGFFSAFYIYLVHRTSLLPGNAHSNFVTLIIGLSIALPEIVIWLIAARGAIRFKEYAGSIKTAKDGFGLNLVADALLWWLAYVVLLTVSATTLSVVREASYLRTAVVISNHLPLLVGLIASVFFFLGARRLNTIVPLRISRNHRVFWWTVAIVVGLTFIMYFYHFEPQLGPVDNIPRFVLPLNLLLFTYALPYIATWILGIYACVSLNNFAHHTKGAIYRPLFKRFAYGMTLVFVCIFCAQFLVVSRVSLMHVNWLLLPIYVLLVLGVGGFFLIYRGARELHRIEQV